MNSSNIFSLVLFNLIIQLPLTIWSCFVTSISNIKCAFELLLHNQFSFSSSSSSLIDYLIFNKTNPKPSLDEPFEVTRHAPRSAEKCMVCLGEVVEGDEIGELRCSHVFHRLCLRNWVRFSHQNTCPICRGSLAPRLGGDYGHFGVEVFCFNFCSFGVNEDDQRDSWWLR